MSVQTAAAWIAQEHGDARAMTGVDGKDASRARAWRVAMGSGERDAVGTRRMGGA